MPLTLTATAGGSSSNAYALVADAEAWASYRVGGAAFIALTADQKIQALVTAASDIDTVGDAFIGDRETDTQAMEWPRDDGDLSAILVRANIELAMSYAPAFAAGYTGDVLNLDLANGNIKREKTGPLETEYFAATSTTVSVLARFPLIVQRLLASLIETTASGWGGSATVSRGS